MQAGWRQPYNPGVASTAYANYAPRGGAVPYNNPNPWAAAPTNPWAGPGTAGPSGWPAPNVQSKQRIYKTAAAAQSQPVDDPYEIKPSGHGRQSKVASTQPVQMSEKLLRSALKKTASPWDQTVPLQRHRSTSDPRRSSISKPLTRPRTNSKPGFVPNHMWMTLEGKDGLKIDGANVNTLDSLVEQIPPMWKQYGTSVDPVRKSPWRVRFGGNPWTASGEDGLLAKRILLRVFEVFQHHGYHFLSVVKSGSSTPRLAFIHTDQAHYARLFIVAFSRSQQRVELINPPSEVADAFGESMRYSLPHKIQSAKLIEDGVYAMEMKGYEVSSETEKSIFVGQVLKILDSLGFNLFATVPLGKTGLFGYGGREDLWMFQSRFVAA